MNTPECESYVYVRERAAMEALSERIGAAERVAVDTEADSLHNYFEKVCLIQLSLGEEHYLVDPLAGLELGGFLAALAGKPLILHGGDYDLRMSENTPRNGPSPINPTILPRSAVPEIKK